MNQHGYDEHPVPPRAARYPHLAQFFHEEGDRPFQYKTTGDALARELTRGLSPHARRFMEVEG